MTTYKVAAQNGVKHFASGQSWKRGQAIGPVGLPPKLWDTLLKEGAVVEDKPAVNLNTKPLSEPVAKKQTRRRKVTK